MDINGVKNFKYTRLSNVQRKFMKNNADDDSKGDDNFDTVNSNLRKKRSMELMMPGDASEGAPENALPKTPQIFSAQNEDALKRAMLFMDHKRGTSI
jgi:hypothetical protein